MHLHALRSSRSVAMLALALVVSGCSTWKPLHAPVSEAVAGPKPEKHLLVHLRDGSRVELDVLEVTADSLRGWAYGPNPRFPKNGLDAKHGHPCAIALADVAKVESRQKDGALTALAIVGIAGLVTVVAGVIAVTQMDPLVSFEY